MAEENIDHLVESAVKHGFDIRETVRKWGARRDALSDEERARAKVPIVCAKIREHLGNPGGRARAWPWPIKNTPAVRRKKTRRKSATT